jgi:hypothetical protein
MNTYTFAVPCSYIYKIEAETEHEATLKLRKYGGIDLHGELSIEDMDYNYPTLIDIDRNTDETRTD